MIQTPKSQIPLDFIFQQSQGKLLIKAQTDSKTYVHQMEGVPSSFLGELKGALIAQQFKVTTISNAILNLKIGFMNLEFKNYEQTVISSLRKQIQRLGAKVEKNAEMEAIIKEQESKINYLTKDFSQLIERLSQIEQMNRESKQRIEKIENINIKMNSIFFFSQFSAKSRIVINNQQMETIKEFFHPQKISHIQMLYRASENVFSTYQFHAKCNYIPNTLTLCQTEFGKKIGGYTPLAWCSGGTNRPDPSVKSFIFSLTNRDKFVMNQFQNAINDQASYGPTFGNGNDLYICDNANTTNSSYSQINTIYHNNKYVKGDGGSWQRFNGNPAGSSGGHNFKLREWEVWRVIFEEDEQMGNN